MPPWKNERVNPTTDKSIVERSRPVLSRAEVATLAGMTLCVASLFLTWKREPISQAMLHSLPATLILNPPSDIAVKGFGLPLHWPLAVCAVLCGAGLLVVPRPHTRARWTALHITAAGSCLLIPLVRFALQPGVIAALIGGCLALFGALERFGIGDAPPVKEDA